MKTTTHELIKKAEALGLTAKMENADANPGEPEAFPALVIKAETGERKIFFTSATAEAFLDGVHWGRFVYGRPPNEDESRKAIRDAKNRVIAEGG